MLDRQRGHRRILAVYCRWRVKGECFTPAQPLGHLADDLPIGAGFSGGGEQRALAADTAFGIGHRAVLFAPGQRGQADVREASGVSVGHHVRDHHGRALGQRRAHEIGVGHRYRRVGRHHPQKLDPSVVDRAEQIDRFKPGASAEIWRCPKLCHVGALGLRKPQMAGQHVGQSAHLAPAHRVGLPGDAERPGPGAIDPPGGKMQVDDRVAFVGAAGGLIGTLAEQRNHPRMRRDQIGELRKSGWIDPVIARQRSPEPVRHFQPARISQPAPIQLGQQRVEQRDIAIGRDRHVQVGLLGGFGAARIDHHQLGPARCARLFDPLPDHRVTPGGVRSDQHNQIGAIKVVVSARHNVFAKRTDVRGDRAGHA